VIRTRITRAAKHEDHTALARPVLNYDLAQLEETAAAERRA